VSLEELTACFRFGLKEAAAHLEMCPTTLKRICRTHRVGRWPSRKKWRAELEPALRRDGPAGVARIMVAAPPAPPAGVQGTVGLAFCFSCGVALRGGGQAFCHACGVKMPS